MLWGEWGYCGESGILWKYCGENRGAGRKPKSEEIALIEKLDKVIDPFKAIEKLDTLIDKGDFKAIQLYLNYRFGRPKDKVDITSGNEKIDYSGLSYEELYLLKYGKKPK